MSSRAGMFQSETLFVRFGMATVLPAENQTSEKDTFCQVSEGYIFRVTI